MRNPFAKITISVMIVLTLLSTQILLPLQASAENKFLNYNDPNKDGNNPPFKLNFGNVTPQLLTSVVSCTNLQNKIAAKLLVVNDTIKKELDKLVKKALAEVQKALISKAKRKAIEEAAEAAREAVLAGSAVGATAASSTVAGTGAPGAAQAILDVLTDVPHQNTTKVELTPEERKAAQKAEDDKIKAAAKLEQAERTERCINGIAIRLAKNQLSSMTKYTMNWVNSGFNGDPLFVRNVDSLMYSIETRILQEENKFFKDPASAEDYPYGRDFALSSINARQYADNFLNSMKSNMADFIPGTDSGSDAVDKFSGDFSSGGWDGWMALTQNSQNNPLGSQIKMAQNLSDKIAKEKENTKDELNRNGGVLDQRKCVQYYPYDPVKDKDNPLNANGNRLRCAKFETVTPGSVIKTKIDTYVNTPERQLELVRTMDDALNSLFASFLKMFQNQGLSSLGSQVNDYAGTATAGFGVNQVLDSNGNSILVPNTTGTGNSGSSNGDVDLVKDLGNTYVNGAIVKKGIIQIQYDYIKSAKESQLALDKVVPSIGKLDYCIPGPNPNWRTNSLESIDSYLSSIDTVTTPPIEPSTIDDQLTEYGNGVEAVYGASSPMQTSANSSYLAMATTGLDITKDLVETSEGVTEAKDEYRNLIAESNTNMDKLKVIKDKVNVIIVAAQNRRTTARASAGLPVIRASCLATEKVTYMDNGVIR